MRGRGRGGRDDRGRGGRGGARGGRRDGGTNRLLLARYYCILILLF